MSFPRLNIDQLNILLMLLSCAIAFIIPFELVLLSYAFLGPAHYLTEISWLHDRKYFTGVKWLWLPLAALAAFMVYISFVDKNNIAASYIALVLGLSLSLALISPVSRAYQALIGAGAMIIFLALKGIYPPFELALAILLPTVIHIYVFTGLFMLTGVLKSKSRWGMAACTLFVVCGLSFFFVTPSTLMLSPDFISYNLGLFDGLTDYLVNLLSFNGTINGHSVLAFLSFAYTYHYLNWFSKTEVIKWHFIPRARLYGIVALYILSISIYMINFKAGFIVLTFLSLAHVFMEFPLNIVSLKTIASSFPRKGVKNA